MAKRALKPAATAEDPAPDATPPDPGLLLVRRKEGESGEAAMARTALSPTVGAAHVSNAYKLPAMPVLHISDLINELEGQSKAAQGNDLSRCEAMLVAQAHTLDAIATRMALAARTQFDTSLDAVEVCLKLSLRAQAQCRATVETLAAIKNPPVMWAKQVNMANGPQQVNNGSRPEGCNPAQAAETKMPQNKLLESRDGERMDPRTTGTAGRDDPDLEAVEAVNRPKKRSRQGTR